MSLFLALSGIMEDLSGLLVMNIINWLRIINNLMNMIN